MEYRRRPGRDVWHFHRRCQWWEIPLTVLRDEGTLPPGVKVRHERPTTGEFCNECRGKTKRDAE